MHRIFRAAFTELVGLVEHADDPGQRTAILGHLDFTLTGLHHHHEGEDVHLWPLLLKRARPEAQQVLRMETQHERVAALAGDVRSAARTWGASRPVPGPAAQALVTALRVFLAALEEHLDEEERLVVPLLAQHVSAREWEDFGTAMSTGMPRSALPLMLGQLLEVASPTEAADFLADLPRPARLMWRISGRRRYSSYIDRVRNTRPTQ